MKQMSKGGKKKKMQTKKPEWYYREQTNCSQRDVGGRMCDIHDGDKEDTYHNEH